MIEMKPITKLRRPREDMLAATFFWLINSQLFHYLWITRIAHTNFKVKLKFILIENLMVVLYIFGQIYVFGLN